MAKRIVGRHVCCWVEHMDSDWQTSFDQKYVWSNRRERRWRWPAFARTQFPSCPPSRDDKDFINRPNAMGPWPDVSAKPTRSIACNRGLGQQTNLWWFHQMKTTSDLRNDWFLMNVCLMFLFLFSFYLSLLPVLHLLLGLRVWCDVRLCVCAPNEIPAGCWYQSTKTKKNKIVAHVHITLDLLLRLSAERNCNSLSLT